MAINKRRDKYVLDWWADGKRFRKFFDTKTEAKDYETGIKHKKLSGDYIAPGKAPLFREAAATWLATRSDRAPATFDLYHNQIDQHLLPRFGDRRVDQISHELIAAWRAELAQTGGTSQWRKPMARGTITAIVRVLSSILDAAVRGGRLSSNPVGRLEPQYTRARVGKREDVEVRPDEILNPEEIRRLLEAAEPGRWRTLFTLAAATGARSGELLGLRWDNVVFNGKPRIEIRRSLSRAKGPHGGKNTPHFGPPKTDAGTRDIPIGPSVVHALKAWKLQAGRNEHDLVFVNSDGAPLDRSVVLRRGFYPALKRAGLRHVKFHSLLHSYASGLIANDAKITEVQHLLGHADVAVTMRVYSHWYKDADSGAAARYVDQLFDGTEGTK
jgi:integrase